MPIDLEIGSRKRDYKAGEIHVELPKRNLRIERADIFILMQIDGEGDTLEVEWRRNLGNVGNIYP